MASMEDGDTKLAGTNLVHELVHSALPSPRPWVYEGLAHFAEAVYREQQGGREAALDLLELIGRPFLMRKKNPGSVGTKYRANLWPLRSTKLTIAARRPMCGGCCATWSATMR